SPEEARPSTPCAANTARAKRSSHAGSPNEPNAEDWRPPRSRSPKPKPHYTDWRRSTGDSPNDSPPPPTNPALFAPSSTPGSTPSKNTYWTPGRLRRTTRRPSPPQSTNSPNSGSPTWHARPPHSPRPYAATGKPSPTTTPPPPKPSSPGSGDRNPWRPPPAGPPEYVGTSTTSEPSASSRACSRSYVTADIRACYSSSTKPKRCNESAAMSAKKASTRYVSSLTKSTPAASPDCSSCSPGHPRSSTDNRVCNASHHWHNVSPPISPPTRASTHPARCSFGSPVSTSTGSVSSAGPCASSTQEWRATRSGCGRWWTTPTSPSSRKHSPANSVGRSAWHPGCSCANSWPTCSTG